MKSVEVLAQLKIPYGNTLMLKIRHISSEESFGAVLLRAASKVELERLVLKGSKSKFLQSKCSKHHCEADLLKTIS